VTRVRPPTRHDRLKAKEIRTKEVRERQREGRNESNPSSFLTFRFIFFIWVLIGLLIMTTQKHFNSFIFASPLSPVKLVNQGLPIKVSYAYFRWWT
jgi:hypothetical protein